METLSKHFLALVAISTFCITAYAQVTYTGTTNSGTYSSAIGSNTTSSGSYSFAFGGRSTASGSYSVAGGNNAKSGAYSVALGNWATASGDVSVALGDAAVATGNRSYSFGRGTNANVSHTVVLGTFNATMSGSTSSWVNTDPLFVIGNGTGYSDRSTAMTILKNGHAGIGTTTPGSLLDVNGMTYSKGISLLNGTDVTLKASSGSNDPGDVVFQDGSGNEAARIWAFSTSNLYIRGNHGGYGGIRMNLTTENIGIKSFASSSYALYVNGDAYSTGSWTSSDIRGKKGISSIDQSYTDKLLNLRGASYTLKPRETQKNSPALSDSEAKETNTTVYSEDHFTRKRVGFIAQEVQKVYPELVKEDEHGYLAVDYQGFIPIIVEKLKQNEEIIDKLSETLVGYQEKIMALETELANLRQNKSLNPSKKDLGVNTETDAELFQNQPNPFNKDTQINYRLPENVNDAMLFIYDMNGRQIKKVPLLEKTGSITIQQHELEAGLYMYSLVTNGQVIATKKMILTD